MEQAWKAGGANEETPMKRLKAACEASNTAMEPHVARIYQWRFVMSTHYYN